MFEISLFYNFQPKLNFQLDYFSRNKQFQKPNKKFKNLKIVKKIFLLYQRFYLITSGISHTSQTYRKWNRKAHQNVELFLF